MHDGATDKALDELRAGYALAEAEHDAASMSGDLVQMGDVLREAGKMDDAAAKYAEAVKVIDQSAVPQQVKDATRRNHVFETSRLAVARGDLGAARSKADEYASLIAARKAPFEVRQLAELRGSIALADKRGAEAVKELTRCQPAGSQSPVPDRARVPRVRRRPPGGSVREEGRQVQRPVVQLRVRAEQGRDDEWSGDRVTRRPTAQSRESHEGHEEHEVINLVFFFVLFVGLRAQREAQREHDRSVTAKLPEEIAAMSSLALPSAMRQCGEGHDGRRLALAIGLLLMALGSALPLAGASTQPPASTPNVVVLVIDDTRWDSIGVAGNRIVRTPGLDRLAADGIRFTQARVTTSICMVSRATLLTGQYMSRHGIDRFGKPLTPEAFASDLPRPAAQRRLLDRLRRKVRRRRGAARGLRLRAHLSGAPLARGRRRRARPRHRAECAGFARVPARASEGQAVPAERRLFRAARRRRREGAVPAAGLERGRYRGVKVPPSPLGDAKFLQALPPFLSADANEGRVRFNWRFDTPERYQDYMIRYYRLITEVDAAVGRLVDELKAQGVYDNTLIVFIGDNGYFHGDRGLADKWYPYEQALRVPLIVRDPRLPAAAAARPATAGAEHRHRPDDRWRPPACRSRTRMQGRDLSPLYLADRAPAWRDEFFYEHPTITSRDRIPSSQGVIRRDWKYVSWPEFDYEQLFDLKKDAQELNNLAGRPAYAERQAAMRQQLDEWRTRGR